MPLAGLFPKNLIFVLVNHLAMTERKISIKYTEYASLSELSQGDRELAQAAIDAIQGSYAPYSHFNVGAAVRLSGGDIVTGANQENAAFPSSLCAERTAMFSAGASHPDEAMVSIALAGSSDGVLTGTPATPCGSCRQVMAQYQLKGGQPMSVIMVGADRIWKFDRVDDILPLIFDSI